MPIRLSPPPSARAVAALLVSALVTGAAPAHAEILIGLAAPSSGREQKAGEAMRQAAEQAISELNLKGGVKGERLALTVLDDVCTSDGAVAAANSFIQKRVRLVIGHPCARAALAAAQVYGPAGVIFIAPATRHPALTDKRAGKTIFRLSGRDDQQAANAAAWLLEQPGTGPFALIHDKTAYSRGLAAGVMAALVAKVLPAPLDFPITAGENVYAPVIAKLKLSPPRAVFFAGYPAEADIIVSALRAAGITAPVLGSDSLATAEFTTQRAASDPAVQVLTRYRSGLDENMAAQTTGVASTNRDSGSVAAAREHTYAAIVSWADAAQRAVSFEADKISSELARASAVALAPPDTGPHASMLISFDEKGDARIPSFFPARWTGSQWVAVK
jgi:branched-chain amino acid transport system substrate-binding protein